MMREKENKDALLKSNVSLEMDVFLNAKSKASPRSFKQWQWFS